MYKLPTFSMKFLSNFNTLFKSNKRFIRCVACEGEVLPPLGIKQDVLQIAEKVLQGERTALAKAASLLENTRKDSIKQSDLLLDYIMRKKAVQVEEQFGPGFHPQSFRIGIAGPPGAGKSTFINAFGTYLCREKLKHLAVLAIDPSSDKSKGSLLGDKTRMKDLILEDNAYIRPSPSGGILGGVAENTVDLVNLMECSGFDIILIETVGLGQLEVLVDNMVDMFLLLMPPAMGDELQGVKKGIMEHADLVVITKADGILMMPAKKTASEQLRALEMQRQKAPHWKTKTITCSSTTNRNVDKIWEVCESFYSKSLESGEMELKRKHQNTLNMWTKFDQLILDDAVNNSSVQKLSQQLKTEMINGGITRRRAAMKLLDAYLHELSPSL